jgi:hypothetical protein
MFLKKPRRDRYRHIQHISNGSPLIGDLKRFTIVSFTVTLVAGHIDICQKMHVDLQLPISLTLFTSPPGRVKTETPHSVTPRA